MSFLHSMQDAPHASSHSSSPQPSYLSEFVLFPFYDWIVQFYPVWWNPNKVTLFGVFCTLTSSILLLSSMAPGTVFIPGKASLWPATLLVPDSSVLRETSLYPTAIKPSLDFLFTPKSLLVVCGLLNMIYCIADNTDGRLARRLKKSSEIGEYLDHGLDCVTSLLSAAVAFPIVGGSLSNMSLSLVLIAFVTLLSHTLHYEKNIFIWGNRLATVDEAMVFFSICNWIPLIFPRIGIETVSPSILNYLFNDAWAQYFSPLKMVEIIYVLYSFCQFQVIVNISRLNLKMLFRAHSLVSVANGLIFLALIPVHTQIIQGHVGAYVPGYTLASFSYPAVWVVTAACTSSIIVHIPIYSRCARLKESNFMPLLGVFVVWMLFLPCPVAGMIFAVVWHFIQILMNIRSLVAQGGGNKKR